MSIIKASYNGFGTKNQKRGFRNICHLTGILFFVFLFAGCGPQRVTRQDTLQQEKGEAGLVVIEAIGVVGEGDSILIEASGKIKYTAFRLTDPSRLIIDMPDVSLDIVDKPINVNNDFITEIKTSTYGYGDRKIGRIEVGLREGIEHEIKAGKDSLVAKLRRDVFISIFAGQQQEEGMEDRQAEVVEPEVIEETLTGGEGTDLAGVEEVVEETENEEASMEEQPLPWDVSEQEEVIDEALVKLGRADKILNIETEEIEGGTLVKIITNGMPGNYNSFGLDSPARLVIDVWGVENLVKDKTIDVDDIYVKRVRIGEHPGKSRIVVDSSKDILPPYSIEKVGNTILVRFGGVYKEAVAIREGLPAVLPWEGVAREVAEGIEAEEAPRLMIAKKEAVRDIRIESVEFEKLDDKARLKITTSERAEYKVSKSIDASVIALDFKDAHISYELSRVLDASELRTPVLSIGSFQVSEEPASIVRVLVKLKGPSEYTISQIGGDVYIDFPIPREEMVAVSEQVSQREMGIQPIGDAAIAAKYKGRKISLDFKDADITNILRLIAEVSDLNIISGDDVRGNVSLRLVDVPWDQAFDIILRTKGLGKVQEGNIVRVAPLAKIKQEEDAILAARKAREKLEDLSIKLLPVNYAKASELESQVKNLLSDRGSVSTEKRTNTLVIRDIKANIEEVVKLVKGLDSPTPQVLIETRIVEAQSTFARDLGIQWGIAHHTADVNEFKSTFGSSGTAPPSTITPTGFIATGGTFTEQPNFAVNLPATGSAGILGALGFTFGKLTGDSLLLDLRLTAGEQAGLTKTISRPRITTLDNKEAKIEQGESIPFETTSAEGTKTQFIDANLSLTVTPHITPDGRVSMKIKVSSNSIGSFRTASGAPSIDKKEASTEVLVKDGETTVIGGIVVSDKTNTDRGIPFLKDIPILGWLFKSKSVSDNQTELLIFITPMILKEEKTG
jgi:type IV pilus assembly protein PilQ